MIVPRPVETLASETEARVDSWPGRARTALEECAAVCREMGDRYILSTARLNLAFRAPIETGRRLRAEGWVVEDRRRVIRAAGPVLERGTHLVRAARVERHTLALTGDADRAATLEVFAPPGIRDVTWNGRPVVTKAKASGSLLGTVPGPRAGGLHG